MVILWIGNTIFNSDQGHSQRGGDWRSLSSPLPSEKPSPLDPPNEMTLCTGVYGEPPFWVPPPSFGKSTLLADSPIILFTSRFPWPSARIKVQLSNHHFFDKLKHLTFKEILKKKKKKNIKYSYYKRCIKSIWFHCCSMIDIYSIWRNYLTWSQFMLSKFNCNTLGWNTVPSFLYMIFSWPLYWAIDPQCVCMFLNRMHDLISSSQYM